MIRTSLIKDMKYLLLFLVFALPVLAQDEVVYYLVCEEARTIGANGTEFLEIEAEPTLSRMSIKAGSLTLKTLDEEFKVISEENYRADVEGRRVLAVNGYGNVHLLIDFTTMRYSMSQSQASLSGGFAVVKIMLGRVSITIAGSEAN